MNYNSLNGYLLRTFGEKVYKITLSGGMTCPNRDGTLGTRGCIFCGEGGSGDFAEPVCGDISAALERAKARVRAKTDAKKFIAYFQSYTNTYAPAKRLEELFLPLLEREEIVALSVGTRPDCLPDDVLALLERLQKIKPVFVELGLQTIHERTATFIRRGYPLQVYDEVIENLNAIGVNAVTHVILGLPHETEREMLETVRYVGQSGAHGIKLQLLHVLRGTDLATLYERGEFDTLSLERYVDLVCRALELLPPELVIHRLTGDAPKKLLLAPLWSADKKRVLNTLAAELTRRNVVQGRQL